MQSDPSGSAGFESEVAGRFGMLPNFFRSADAAPELIQQLWGFAKAGYLDNPMPSLFKERLFVWLSRFCPARYCIVRHVGFLLGYGRAAGDCAVAGQSLDEVVRLLTLPTPWKRDMAELYARLEAIPAPGEEWPDAGTAMEDWVFACAAILFVEPARSERARHALIRAFGARRFEFLSGCLAFIRTAHYWTMLHPEIQVEEDMQSLLRGHEDLARLLLADTESDRFEMGERLFGELAALRDLNERDELRKAKQALEAKDRQKDQFIAVLAHELRNPLAAIRAATDAMSLLDLKDPRAARLRERLDRQTTAMARMLEDLLDASRIALGKVSVQTEPVELGELLGDVLDEQELRVREAGLHFETRLTSVPCVVLGDRVRLRQIVDNLLSNAVKFTPAGGSVMLALAVEGEFAVVTVKDTGLGFDADFAVRLFEPFTQEAQGLARSGGGLGLGLAIASRLTELQGGALSAVSTGSGRGALFRLQMPLGQRLSPSPEKASDPTRRPAQTSLLLVEDNKDVADGLAELLRLAGAQVNVTYDGPSAIRRALESIPDIVLCDLGLPGSMDGYAVARACRDEPALRSVRLIAASGYSSPQDHADAKQAGFDRLLTKPLTRESLEAILREERD